ncbi:MAG: OsmC family protein [Bacteroidia bacterium]|nr:OsmC family protein [Bacteroidia bacterium]MCZ2276940.1 OsmC family protein [Bacteroidia bacterium]
MSKEHYYEVNLQWKQDRRGVLSSPVLNDTIECATPPEFPNGIPGIWSPEHLYAASINSCYMATFLAVAENSKLAFTDFSCKTVCKLEQVEGKFRITKAVITPEVTLENAENDYEKLLRLFEKSKAVCLVTNSMKTEVSLDFSLINTV